MTLINSTLINGSKKGSPVPTPSIFVAPLFGFAILGNYQLGIQLVAILGILPGIVYQYILPRDSSGESNKKLKKLTEKV